MINQGANVREIKSVFVKFFKRHETTFSKFDKTSEQIIVELRFQLSLPPFVFFVVVVLYCYKALVRIDASCFAFVSSLSTCNVLRFSIMLVNHVSVLKIHACFPYFGK